MSHDVSASPAVASHPIAVVVRFVLAIVGGFFAGAAFAMSLVVGVALFVGNVVMRPAMNGSDLERILDYVAGPAALVFAVIGVAVGVVRVRRRLRIERAGADAADHVAAAREGLGGFALAVVVAIAIGALAWPWLIIVLTERELDSGALVGATAIPLAVGLIALLAWLVFRTPRAAPTGSGPRAALRRTPPPLVATAVASSMLLAVGTLSAIADWHELLLVLIGLPMTVAIFFAHLFSCIWFFRPMPR